MADTWISPGVALAGLVVLALLIMIWLNFRPSSGETFSSFQFWTQDPAYDGPLQSPWAPHSQLMAAALPLEGGEVQPPYSDVGTPLSKIKRQSSCQQESAGMTSRPGPE